MSPRCHGRHPRVCRRGLITQATTYGCLTHLLAANPTYHPSCVIMVQRRIPIDTIHPHQNIGFVLATNGSTFIKRCASQAERAATLEAGVYRLQLTFPCSLHGKDWTLKTTFTRETNITLQADSARTQVSYSITEMLTHNELDEPVVQQLQDLDEVGKVQVRLGALLARPAGLTRTPGGLNWLHFLRLCAIPPRAIATYLKRRRLFNRSDRRGASKNYVPGSESTEDSVPTPNTAAFVFDTNGGN